MKTLYAATLTAKLVHTPELATFHLLRLFPTYEAARADAVRAWDEMLRSSRGNDYELVPDSVKFHVRAYDVVGE